MTPFVASAHPLTAPAARRSAAPAGAHRRTWRSRFVAFAHRALGRPAGGELARPPHPAPATVQGPRAAAVPPAMRSVPVPLAALTHALDQHPLARSRMRHLALVESSCLLCPAAPFGRLPPRAIEIALRQLDVLLVHHPALHVLRLQLERHRQAHRSRVAAALAAEDRKWRPEPGDSTFGIAFPGDSVLGGPWGTTGFMETLPLEHAPARAAA